MQNPLNISAHKCQSTQGMHGSAPFCSICGVHMPSNSRNLKIHRSSRFNVRDSVKMDQGLLYKNMLKKQCQNRFFNMDSCHIEVRPDLIDFVTDIGSELGFRDLTINSAIAIFDAVFSLYFIKKQQMKMVAYVSLHLSAKMHENNNKIPKLSTICQLFQNAYTLSELEECERSLFKILNYRMDVTTPLAFVELFLSRGLISSKDKKSFGKRLGKKQFEHKLNRFENLVYHYINLSNAYYEFYQFTPVAIATSAILCARKEMGFEEYWPWHVQELTGINLESIVKCAESLFYVGQDESEYEEEVEESEHEMEEESPMKQVSASGKDTTYLEDDCFSKRMSYDRISEFEFPDDEYEGFDVC